MDLDGFLNFRIVILIRLLSDVGSALYIVGCLAPSTLQMLVAYISPVVRSVPSRTKLPSIENHYFWKETFDNVWRHFCLAQLVRGQRGQVLRASEKRWPEMLLNTLSAQDSTHRRAACSEWRQCQVEKPCLGGSTNFHFSSGHSEGASRIHFPC